VVAAQAMPVKRKLQYQQLQDPKFRNQSTKQEDYHKFELLNGLNFKKDPDKPRFTVPSSMINSIIRVYNNIAHYDLKKKNNQKNYS